MKYDDFKKELKSRTGLDSSKLDIMYNEGDSRCWTAIVGKTSTNVFVTFHVNRGEPRVKNFDLLGNRKQLIEVSVYNVFDQLAYMVPTLDLD